MLARIYKPAKTAMQSGKTRSDDWLLEYEPAEKRVHDPLMGWISSGDTNAQVRLSFETKDEAVAFAERQGIPTRSSSPNLVGPPSRRMRTISAITAAARGPTDRPRSSTG